MNESAKIKSKQNAKRRTAQFPLVLAGIYFAWSAGIYFCTLGKTGHEWWPVFVYFITWPLSALFESSFGKSVTHWFNDWFLDGSPRSYETISAVFYIIGGTIWVWWIVGFAQAITIRVVNPLKRRLSEHP